MSMHGTMCALLIQRNVFVHLHFCRQRMGLYPFMVFEFNFLNTFFCFRSVAQSSIHLFSLWTAQLSITTFRTQEIIKIWRHCPTTGAAPHYAILGESILFNQSRLRRAKPPTLILFKKASSEFSFCDTAHTRKVSPLFRKHKRTTDSQSSANRSRR